MALDRWVRQASGLFLPRFAKGSQPYPCAECCGGRQCFACSGEVPSQMQLEINNVTNGNCNECVAILNDTFVLDWVGETVHDAVPWCQWRYIFPSAFCTDFDNLDLYIHSGAIRVDLTDTEGTLWLILFIKTITGPIDCSTVDEWLNYSNYLLCNTTSSTCHLMAL